MTRYGPIGQPCNPLLDSARATPHSVAAPGHLRTGCALCPGQQDESALSLYQPRRRILRSKPPMVRSPPTRQRSSVPARHTWLTLRIVPFTHFLENFNAQKLCDRKNLSFLASHAIGCGRQGKGRSEERR